MVASIYVLGKTFQIVVGCMKVPLVDVVNFADILFCFYSIGMYHVLLDAQWKDQSLLPKWHMLLKNYMIWVALKSPLVTQLELAHQVTNLMNFELLKFK